MRPVRRLWEQHQAIQPKRYSEKGREQSRKIQVFHSNLIRRFAFLCVVPHADPSEKTLFGSKEARE